MPLSDYAREHLGSAELAPCRPITAGEQAPLALVYRAGKFGIDDSGSIKVCWRFATDTAKPQFADPAAPDYVSVEASNGALLHYSFDVKNNIRPWGKTLHIKVVKGYLKEGDELVVRYGDSRRGCMGMRWQTFCENDFEFKILVDAFATYDYAELPASPAVPIIPGPPARWRCILPSLRKCGEAFRLAVVPEDRWGNPTNLADGRLHLRCSEAVEGLPAVLEFAKGRFTEEINGLAMHQVSDGAYVELRDDSGELLAVSNPIRVAEETPIRRHWADLHGQSEETIGTNTARDYFSFARDRSFVDACCHQGNDFQITQTFWQRLQELTREFDVPGEFVAFPGYEWSGNTGMGGDHNVIFLREGEQIHRSSHALVYDRSDEDTDCHTFQELVDRLEGRDVFLFGHVGGRYADLSKADYGSFQPAVEVHSAWGTFEWLLHDAFELGMKPGVTANSDGHKGRPGASYPGASMFGSYGGLTCYLCEDLSRASLFEALRARRHYATTGARILVDLFCAGANGEVCMGADLRTARDEVQLTASVVGTAPIARVDVFNGRDHVETIRSFAPTEADDVLCVLWEGAEYRGRGRETVWDGRVELQGSGFTEVRPINFWNPERPLLREGPSAVSWRSITTGGIAGFLASLEHAAAGTLSITTPLVQSSLPVESITAADTIFEAGGLGRRLRVFRLPTQPPGKRLSFTRQIALRNGATNPLYIRTTQYDGHMAWTSPVYVETTQGTHDN